MRTAKIIGIRPLGKMKTCDIEVDNKNHIFYGNGIATSNSHAISYAYHGYYTAYVKYHYPIQFYTSWLHYGLQNQDPFEEIATVANDAKLHNVDVMVPDLRKANKNFKIFSDQIVCGLVAIKKVGNAQIVKLRESLKSLGHTPTWYDVLFLFTDPNSTGKVSSEAFVNLIKVGGLDFCGKSRKEMLKEYALWDELTKLEQTKVIEKYSAQHQPLVDILVNSCSLKSQGGICSSKNRISIVQSLIDSLKSSAYSLQDTPGWIANTEKQLLGLSLTCAAVDECDTYAANCSCKEFINKEVNLKEGYVLAVSLHEIREAKIKNGQNIGKKMAYLTVGDSSGTINNVVAFADVYEKFNEFFVEGNNLLLQGIRDKKQNIFIVKDVEQL
jgi:DNA polymerase-3 subunit alpha